MIQGKDNTFAYTISYDGIDILSILLPLRFLLIEFDSVIDLFQQFMNSSSTIFNIEKFLSDGCLEDVIIFFRRNRLVLSIDHWLLQLGELRVNAVKRFLHLINDFVEIINSLLSCRDEVVDTRRLPFELFHSRLDVLVHFDNSLFYQRLLNIIEASNDSVVVLDNQLKGNNLTTIYISFLEKFRGCLRDISVKLLQIFHLTKKLHENRVEVNFQ